MFAKTNKKTAIFVATLFTFSSLSSCCDAPKKDVAADLISTLNNAVAQNKILLGHQDATAYGHSWKYEADRSDIFEMVGDYPAIIGWDLGDVELSHENNLDGVPFEFMKQEIIKQHERGGINTISWHAYNPVGDTAWDTGEGMVTSILEGGENFEMYQERLALVADFLDSLRDSEGNLIPIIFRPWHEHNGSWFWWGDQWCTHQEYRKLWDMTYKFMEQRGLNNLVWCYMPMENDHDKAPNIEQFDMVGLDEYPYNGRIDTYIESFNAKLDKLKEYKTKYNKIITISETGYEGMPNNNWFTEVVLPLIENEPVSYILFWRNAWDKPEHFFCSFKGHGSEEDFRNFVETPTIITLKEIKSL